MQIATTFFVSKTCAYPKHADHDKAKTNSQHPRHNDTGNKSSLLHITRGIPGKGTWSGMLLRSPRDQKTHSVPLTGASEERDLILALMDAQRFGRGELNLQPQWTAESPHDSFFIGWILM